MRNFKIILWRERTNNFREKLPKKFAYLRCRSLLEVFKSSVHDVLHFYEKKNEISILA